ncbi:PAS domain-containing protein [Sulfitobacter pacificus]|uniref:histidine kinase n=1 Tax=Sulfitobacter pacificus TaxID=1499314 RepID=A0ABQ5VFG1_9RHOB|nr:PAS domain-containing protein [Sulfitobacter pacificus]GLQ25559.1 signal transduction histidine kinase [Sulfitobacter pacificus]
MNIVKSKARWDLKNDRAIAEAVRHARIPLCVSDPNIADNPIVFANDAFMTLTGYTPEEVIGKNCRILQGAGTTPESVNAIRRAIEGQKVETVEILNYRKDGSSFLNALQLGPILDDDGRLIYFFGSQLDISEKREAERKARELAEAELIHRLRNIVNVMAVVIEMTAHEEEDPQALSTTMVERLRALSDAHLRTIGQADEKAIVQTAELITTIVSAYAPKGASQFKLAGDETAIPPHLLSCIALTLHELATNSVKHGALGARDGVIEVAWQTTMTDGDACLSLQWQERNGPSVVKPAQQSGSRIINDLIEAAGGSLELEWHKEGLIARAVLPI